MKLKSIPSISIVIPSYNQGQYLEQTILSIIDQKYPLCEIIIIDGGSSDNTLDIIDKYDGVVSYWVSEKDKGQAEAVNKGIKKATGDFIGWQNSDDIYLRDCFWDFARTANNNPGYDIYYGNRYTINESNVVIWKKYLSKISLFYYKYRGMPLTNQTAFISKKMAVSIGGIDENLHFALDNEFFLRALIKGYAFYHVPRFWGALRHHGFSKTGSGNQEKWKKERDYICKKHNIPDGWIYNVCKYLSILLRFCHLARSPSALAYSISYRFKNSLRSINRKKTVS